VSDDFVYTVFAAGSAQVACRRCPKIAQFAGDSPERRDWMERTHLHGSVHTAWNETDVPSPGPTVALLVASVAGQFRHFPTGVWTRHDVTAAMADLQEFMDSVRQVAEIEAGGPVRPVDHYDHNLAVTYHRRRIDGLLVTGDPVFVMAGELYDGHGVPDSVGTLLPPLSITWPGFEQFMAHVL
jgi:hypothetical protein